jgi:large subunit ribosomal protein L13
MKTYSAKAETVKRSWYLVDAKGKTLGRMASRIAAILRGKHKAEFTPHVDTGDFVIVINATEANVTGNKAQDKIYYSHTQYPGGIKGVSYSKLIEKHPTRAVSFAVKGMLPKNSLGRAMFSKLKVYAGAEHPHAAQQPETLDVLS